MCIRKSHTQQVIDLYNSIQKFPSVGAEKIPADGSKHPKFPAPSARFPLWYTTTVHQNSKFPAGGLRPENFQRAFGPPKFPARHRDGQKTMQLTNAMRQVSAYASLPQARNARPHTRREKNRFHEILEKSVNTRVNRAPTSRFKAPVNTMPFLAMNLCTGAH